MPGTTAVGGEADVPATWPEQPVLAISRLTPHSSSIRNLAYCDAGGGWRWRGRRRHARGRTLCRMQQLSYMSPGIASFLLRQCGPVNLRFGGRGRKRRRRLTTAGSATRSGGGHHRFTGGTAGCDRRPTFAGSGSYRVFRRVFFTPDIGPQGWCL